MSLADQLKSVRLRSTNPPRKKHHEQLLCPDSETYRRMMDETQFERYYETIKQWTFPSVILPVNENQIVALRNGHELFKSLSSTDDDEKTDQCFRMYPNLAELATRIDSCSIKRPVFVRLSTRSPKDAVLLLNKDKFKQIFQQVFNELKSDETSGW